MIFLEYDGQIYAYYLINFLTFNAWEKWCLTELTHWKNIGDRKEQRAKYLTINVCLQCARPAGLNLNSTVSFPRNILADLLRHEDAMRKTAVVEFKL